MFGRHIGREIARGLCDWERRQGMSDMAWEEEREKKRRKQEEKQREAYKRNFGIYPERTWDWR